MAFLSMKQRFILLLALSLGRAGMALAQPTPPATCPSPAPADLTGAVSFGDGTPGSCTQAALQSLLDAGGRIRCDCGPAPLTLKLTAPLTVPNQEVVLDGSNLLTISGNDQVRIFDKAAAADNAGTLLALQNLTLRDGRAVDNGPGSGDRLGGAAIRGQANGRLRVINVRFLNNTGPALQSDGCGAVHTVVYQEVLFAGCTFVGNRGANGGAVGTIGSAQQFINCVFEDNAATGTGGTFDKGGIGGAVYVDGIDQSKASNTMSLCGCLFRRNTAGMQGGAAALIFYQDKGSSASIDRCLFEDSQAQTDLGGGLYYLNGPLTLTNSTFSGNRTPGAGGGAWLTNAPLTMSNCTFVGNAANDGSGGGLGGGLYVGGDPNGSVITSSIINCTFSGNRGANFASAILNGSELTLSNSIFLNNLTGGPYQGNPNYQSNPYAGGTINKGSALTVGRGNVQWPETYAAQFGPAREDWLTPDVRVADTGLLPLADNGGSTPTQALPASSPARGWGLAPGAPPTDQRGVPRPPGAGDAGAFQFGGLGPLPVVLTGFEARRTGPATVGLSWRTASETNCAGFRVERRPASASGTPPTLPASWQAAGWVAGAGSSLTPRAYAWPDAAAGPAAAYYRLAQLDFDGRVSYSAVRVVPAAAATALSLAPNPARAYAELTGSAPAEAPAEALAVLDARGRTVRRCPAGTRRLDLTGLAPGLYLVRLAGGRCLRLLVEPGE